MELNALQNMMMKLERMLDIGTISEEDYTALSEQLLLFRSYALAYKADPTIDWATFIKR